MSAHTMLRRVPESWLLHDAAAFASATRCVPKRRLRTARPVRILSVPCACGEEPYSMAMRGLCLQPDHYDALCHLALLVGHHDNAAGAAELRTHAARIFHRQQATCIPSRHP